MSKIKVLHYIPGFKFGGIESRTIEIFKEIDKTKFEFTFLIQNRERNELVDEIRNNGGEVLYVTPFSAKNFFRHLLDMNSILKSNKFDVIHNYSSSTGFWLFLLSTIHGIKKRILHARTSSFEGSNNIVLRETLKKLSVNFSTDRIAVSKVAGDWMFGDKNYIVLPNSINLKSFVYNDEARKKVREKNNINPKDLLVGHIGRLTYAKNHQFILEIFKELLKLRPESKLMLVGVDKENEEIINKAKILGIADKMILCGYIKDVSDYYSAFDIMVFPSFYEGFPGTLLEAQVSGLECFISSNITEEIKLTERIHFLSLDLPSKEWANEISTIKISKRKNYVKEIASLGYTIENIVIKFEWLYDSSKKK